MDIPKGRTHIYAPRGQAGEYAPLAANPYRGCGHACAYCYVPLVTKQQRGEFDAGAVPREDYLHKLSRDAAKFQTAGITEQVMLSFTTDPYHPGDTTLTRSTLEVLRHFGLSFCTLTKGGLLGTAIIGKPRKASEIFGRGRGDSDRIDQQIWAWPLTDIKPFEPPIPMRGLHAREAA